MKIVRYTLLPSDDSMFDSMTDKAVLYKNGKDSDWYSIEKRARRMASIGSLGKPALTISKNEIRVSTNRGTKFLFKRTYK
jgi:hypothetical protein